MVQKVNGGGLVADDVLRATLRAMPIDQRAETIVAIFRVISGEFAAMVLEHTKPAAPKKPRRSSPVRRIRRRS